MQDISPESLIDPSSSDPKLIPDLQINLDCLSQAMDEVRGEINPNMKQYDQAREKFLADEKNGEMLLATLKDAFVGYEAYAEKYTVQQLPTINDLLDDWGTHECFLTKKQEQYERNMNKIREGKYDTSLKQLFDELIADIKDDIPHLKKAIMLKTKFESLIGNSKFPAAEGEKLLNAIVPGETFGRAYFYGALAFLLDQNRRRTTQTILKTQIAVIRNTYDDNTNLLQCPYFFSLVKEKYNFRMINAQQEAQDETEAYKETLDETTITERNDREQNQKNTCGKQIQGENYFALNIRGRGSKDEDRNFVTPLNGEPTISDLVAVMQKTHSTFIKNREKNEICTTASLAAHSPKDQQIVVFNAGDSPTIMVRINKQNNKLTELRRLTLDNDAKIFDIITRKRKESQGLYFFVNSGKESSNEIEFETRDITLTAGHNMYNALDNSVTPQYSIVDLRDIDLSLEDVFIIQGSDGVFDNRSNALIIEDINNLLSNDKYINENLCKPLGEAICRNIRDVRSDDHSSNVIRIHPDKAYFGGLADGSGGENNEQMETAEFFLKTCIYVMVEKGMIPKGKMPEILSAFEQLKPVAEKVKEAGKQDSYLTPKTIMYSAAISITAFAATKYLQKADSKHCDIF